MKQETDGSFIPKEKLEEAGYGEFARLFEERESR